MHFLAMNTFNAYVILVCDAEQSLGWEVGQGAQKC
jgi:hypothetical protein